MKRITTTVEDKNGQAKRVSVFVDEDTEKVISGVDEHWQREYILEEHKANNRTRAETRRHISYEKNTDRSGNELPCPLDNPEETLLKLEYRTILHNSLRILTDKQYTALWLVIVDRLTYREVGERMGVSLGMARDHYEAALKKLKKYFHKHPQKAPKPWL